MKSIRKSAEKSDGSCYVCINLLVILRYEILFCPSRVVVNVNGAGVYGVGFAFLCLLERPRYYQ